LKRCPITISRFFRDRSVFEALRKQVLPEIAVRAAREKRAAQIWSAGCASGEEPYTLKLLWDLEVASACPGVGLSIVATDVDSAMLARARDACFAATSLSELPAHLFGRAFDEIDARFCVRADHRQRIDFLHQDLRSEAPELRFDLILCRYVAFTYFSEPLQRQVLMKIIGRLASHGYLVIGTHERLPIVEPCLAPLSDAPLIFERKVD
jgi:chemotaxis protein methyltransferase CheR